MGFRFRRSFKIVPGVRLNVSKSGLSASIGRPGATLNVGGKRGARVTVGLPGTGLSYSEQLHSRAHDAPTPPNNEDAAPGSAARGFLIVLVIAVLAVFLGTALHWLMQ